MTLFERPIDELHDDEVFYPRTYWWSLDRLPKLLPNEKQPIVFLHCDDKGKMWLVFEIYDGTPESVEETAIAFAMAYPPLTFG